MQKWIINFYCTGILGAELTFDKILDDELI
jgi:hypothetical protein